MAGDPPRMLRLVKLALPEYDGEGVKLMALAGQGADNTARVDAARQEDSHGHVRNHAQGCGLKEYWPQSLDCLLAPRRRAGPRAKVRAPVLAALGHQGSVRLLKVELPAFAGQQADHV